MNNNKLAWKIFEMLKAGGAEIGNASVPRIELLLDQNKDTFAARLAERIAELEAQREQAKGDARLIINGQIGLIRAIARDYSEATNG